MVDTTTAREIIEIIESEMCHEEGAEDRQGKLIRGAMLLEPDMTVSQAGLEDADELSLVWSPLVEMARWRDEELEQDVCVQIPHHTRFIDDGAFRDCTFLKKVKFPGTVESIGDGAFYGCSSLTQVEFSDCVWRIGDYAFAGCSSLTQVDIPNSVTSIEDKAFSGCTSLTHIEIPDSVTRIGEWAFKDCPNLEVVLPRNSWIDFPPRELGCWFRRAAG